MAVQFFNLRKYKLKFIFFKIEMVKSVEEVSLGLKEISKGGRGILASFTFRLRY